MQILHQVMAVLTYDLGLRTRMTTMACLGNQSYITAVPLLSGLYSWLCANSWIVTEYLCAIGVGGLEVLQETPYKANTGGDPLWRSEDTPRFYRAASDPCP